MCGQGTICTFLLPTTTTEDDHSKRYQLFSKYTPELLASKEIQDELKEFPFTPGPYVPGEKQPIRRRVRRRLREAQRISAEDLEYMQQHPEDMEWLERKVKPRFWQSFLAQIEVRLKEKDEEERLRTTTSPPPDDSRLDSS